MIPLSRLRGRSLAEGSRPITWRDRRRGVLRLRLQEARWLNGLALRDWMGVVSRLFFDTMERVRPRLEAGDLAACERGIIDVLRAIPPSPFHLAAEVTISNEPTAAASLFDAYLHAESKRFDIYAAYTEMNGFDINTDRWYCDLFAYVNSSSDIDDWRTKQPSDHSVDLTITGLEDLQKVYASGALRKKEFRSASYMSSLLVVVKFQRFIQRVASDMKQLRFPLYFTRSAVRRPRTPGS